MTHLSRAFALVALGSFLLVGCSAQDATAPTDTPPANYAIANTPDRLIENFARAHEDMNLREYAQVLHEQFEFVYLADPGASKAATQPREQELASLDGIFNGGHGRDDEGGELAAVADITFSLEPVATWEELGNDQHRRLYHATMTVVHADGTQREVTGLQQLTVARDGEHYRLLGWRDLGAL